MQPADYADAAVPGRVSMLWGSMVIQIKYPKYGYLLCSAVWRRCMLFFLYVQVPVTEYVFKGSNSKKIGKVSKKFFVLR